MKGRKLKYRDVVKGGPKKGFKKFKPQHKKNKFSNKKTSEFTTSLNRNKNPHGKRKPERKYDTKEEPPRKIAKNNETEETKQSESEESDIEAGVDYKKELLLLFKSDKEKDKIRQKEQDSVFTSDDESDDDDDEKPETEKTDEFLLQSNEITETETNQSENESENEEINDEELNEIKETDSFVKHFAFDINESLLNATKQLKKVSITSSRRVNWPKLGNLYMEIPQRLSIENERKLKLLDEEKIYAQPAEFPKRTAVSQNSSDYFIKTQIEKNLSKANPRGVLFTDFQGELFSIFNNYHDLWYTEESLDNIDDIRYVYCLHVVNHVLKTRLNVLHHNAKLAEKKSTDDVSDSYRDQGLVRPKILIVVPFRRSAFIIINKIAEILMPDGGGNSGHLINRKRFVSEFTGNEIYMPKKHPKPLDYAKTFAGNVDDDFKIGLTVTKKSLKFYTNFYASDIIVASPQSLRRVIGAKGDPQYDFDFLASIELLIFDQTEILFMQNPLHLFHVIDHLHLNLSKFRDTDLSRVRSWCLEGHAKYYRQTLIFSSVQMPHIEGLFNAACMNYAGRVLVYNASRGILGRIRISVPHIFRKFDASSWQDEVEARFEFFTKTLLPRIREEQSVIKKPTLIYVPSYFDFVRLRNFFKNEDIGFVQICEYTKESKVARARDMFFHGTKQFMLYTERYHFYNRIRVKGIRHLLFYQLPTFPNFYTEMCNLMESSYLNRKIGDVNSMQVTSIYSNFDMYRLEGVLGTEKSTDLLNSEEKVQRLEPN